MKILITGATGTVGKEILHQCLLRPEVTEVVALSRRPLNDDVSQDHKLRTIIVKDFAKWDEDLLDLIKDADAMIWAMGSFDANPGPNKDYPMTFQHAYVQTLASRPKKDRFRFVFLSGKMVEQDQEKQLCLKEDARKLKGLMEQEGVAFAEKHSSTWQSFFVRPAGVMRKDTVTTSLITTIPGVKEWFISADVLGAYMTDLAVAGNEKEIMIPNARIAEKGRQLLGISECKIPICS